MYILPNISIILSFWFGYQKSPLSDTTKNTYWDLFILNFVEGWISLQDHSLNMPCSRGGGGGEYLPEVRFI